MNQGQIANDITRLIDEGIESLRWCRQHLEERAAVERLRRLQITLSGLALALDYEMDGQHQKAIDALNRADWHHQTVNTIFNHFNPGIGFDDH